MTRFGFLSLGLLSLQAFINTGFAAEADPKVVTAGPSDLAVKVHTSFPHSEIFGIKVINGHPTEAVVSFTNDEPNPVTLNILGASLWDLGEESKIVRNLTASRYGVEIPAKSQEAVIYSFATEMHPQDLRLNIAAILSDSEGGFFTLQAFNGTVSVVEPDTSIFDPPDVIIPLRRIATAVGLTICPSIFLYFFLLACFVGVVYFFYTVWVAPYFPQKRKSSKTGEKRAAPKTPEETSNAAVSSASTYNADWIPSHHINRPEARKVKGGGKKATRA
ncbi:hypothetical protein N7468_001473 [Penicillium chermesinum]|uniref:Translocon-associated protein subunit alpha n=1 Tax=Penicillium chermesinum TaxID=63820 RepID=A0A9W9TWT2_9EURO|nr:uncharacterized protein N7468_001473 [Penicillium chermesinum]KAJ5246490.1 hypothetical protein N7468_001473 [Penicillium chermesinum]